MTRYRITPPSRFFSDGMTAILLVCLMFVQNLRRTYECLYISIYSNSTMNVAHYFLGFLLYGTFWIAVMAQAPDLNTYRGWYWTFIAINNHMDIKNIDPTYDIQIRILL